LAGLLIEQGQLKANCNQQNQSKKQKKNKGKNGQKWKAKINGKAQPKGRKGTHISSQMSCIVRGRTMHNY